MEKVISTHTHKHIRIGRRKNSFLARKEKIKIPIDVRPLVISMHDVLLLYRRGLFIDHPVTPLFFYIK